VAHICEAQGVSQRRACAALGVDRSSMRYRSRRSDDAELRETIRRIAAERRRFGYRRIHVMLAREGVWVNQKKLRRLYAEEKLQVKRRGGRKRALGTRRTGAGRWTSSPTPSPIVGGSASWRWWTTSPANAWR
jgi:putative transposase